MLGRVATRSFGVHAQPGSLRAVNLPFQSRRYSKNNKPRKQFEYKPPSPPSHYQNDKAAQRAAGETAAAATEAGGPISSSANAMQPPLTTAQLEKKLKNLDEQIKFLEHSCSSKSDTAREYPKLENGLNTLPLQTTNKVHNPTSPSSKSRGEAQAEDAGAQPSTHLPDLTQGIPSTLDVEMAARSGKSAAASLNITEDPTAGGGKGGGDLPKTAYISSLERKRARIARWIYSVILFNFGATAVWFGRNWESEEEERKHPGAPSGWGFGLFYNRMRARWRDTLDYYNEPAFPKLLPNPDPAWERPYTLILSLEDLLVHSEWSREYGWRMAKRPGVDYFLRYLSGYYELVIWTSAQSAIAQPIIQKLDPYRVVMWPLFREATRYQKGEYIKDLSYLNRDLKKVLMVDTESSHAKHQPENAIILPKWKGSPTDKELISLIPFLEYCAAMNFEDLRAVLKSFEGKHIPTEFARREAIAREKFQKQVAEERAKRPKRSMGLLSSLKGPQSQMVGPDGTPLPSWSDGIEQGKTYQDLVRERGQKQYEMLEKEITQNGEKWLKEMAEEEKKLNEEAMKGMKSSITGYLPFIGGESGGAKKN
ncbi:MAG: hypothetical protein Q9163_005398 [Psora crenata]